MNVVTSVASLFDGSPPFRIEAFDGSAIDASEASPPVTSLKVLRREALYRADPTWGSWAWRGPLSRATSTWMATWTASSIFGCRRSQSCCDGAGSLPSHPDRCVRPSPRCSTSHRSSTSWRVAQSFARPAGRHPPLRRLEPLLRMILGPSMTYSCAVFASPDDPLEIAQTRKVDLIAKKLGLSEGDRILDIGCGWGTMAIHAARAYGARVVGVTLSEPQARYAAERARREGVSDLVEFRVQDYRDVRRPLRRGVLDRHVRARRSPLTGDLHPADLRLLRPGGRFLNHAIGRPVSFEEDPDPSRAAETWRQVKVVVGSRGPSRIYSPFIERYVFPDGELHEVGTMVSFLQGHGFEVRHVESLREHYALTLRQWISNLLKRYDEAVEEVGEQRARVWRLYMSGSAVGFERHHLEIHHILSVRADHGRSGLELRPRFEPDF